MKTAETLKKKKSDASVASAAKSKFRITASKAGKARNKFDVDLNNSLLALAGKSTNLGGWYVDLKRNRNVWSDTVCEIHDVPRGTVTTVEDGIHFYPPEYREKITELFTDCFKKGKSFDADLQIISARGRRVWVRAIGRPYKDKSGKITHVFGTFQDISMGKKAENALKESEEKYRKLIEISQDAIFINRKDKIFYVNPAFMKLYGISNRREIIGKPPFVLFPDRYHEIVKQRIKNIRNTDTPAPYMEIEFIKKNGKIVEMEVNGSPFEFRGEKLIQVVLRDISARKKAEREVISSRKIFESIFNSNPIAILITVRWTGQIIDVNDRFLQMTGFTKEEIIYKKITEIDFQIKDSDKKHIRKSLDEKGYSDFIETHILTKGGRKIFVRSSNKVIDIEGEKYILSMIEDITKIKQLENMEKIKFRLKMSSFSQTFEDFLTEVLNECEKLTESKVSFLNFVNEEKKTVSLQACSTRAKSEYCKSKDGKNYYPIEQSPAREECLSKGKAVINNNITSGGVKNGKSEDYKKIARELAIPVYYNRKLVAVASVGNKEKDYTEQDADNFKTLFDFIWELVEIKKTEKELLMTEALMESEAHLKEMNDTKDKFFSIIAHDLRSPFNAILGLSEIIRDQAKEGDYANLEEHARFLFDGSKHAMNLLLNLLEWSRSQSGILKPNPEYFDMSEKAEKIKIQLGETAKNKEITIKNNVAKGTTVFADKAMTAVVLRNLISNAIKYSFKGGEIKLSADCEDGLVKIKVEDSGTGMTELTINKLFKLEKNRSVPGTENEKGTGLGLLLCKEFIEKQNGKIWAESEQGKGSTFYFSLPGKDGK